MKRFKVIGVDASMSNMGVVAAYIEERDGSYHVVPFKNWLIQTSKTKNKSILGSSDTINRGRVLYKALAEILSEVDPVMVFAETPSGAKSANGMKSYGIVCMLIAGIEPQAIEVTPDKTKIALCGSKTASKRMMIDRAFQLYPDLIKWNYHGGRLQNNNEHVADAVGVIFAGMRTREFSQIARVLRDQ